MNRDSEITLRPAKSEDHDEILKIAKQSKYTKDFSNRVMFSSDDAYEKGWIRVAEVDGKIVGFTCVRHAKRWPETILYFIGVDDEHKSQGIGEDMIHMVMASGPHSRMRLNVMKDNVRAQQFYERLGFEVSGVAINGEAWSMTKEFGE